MRKGDFRSSYRVHLRGTHSNVETVLLREDSTCYETKISKWFNRYLNQSNEVQFLLYANKFDDAFEVFKRIARQKNIRFAMLECIDGKFVESVVS